MKSYILYFLLICASASAFGQVATVKPKIMVIPFTKDGEDIRTVLDADVNRRIAITKIKEGFDNNGFTTVDFIGKLKAARDNHVFTSDNQTDIKASIIEMSGCDVYVVAEVDAKQENTFASVSTILSAYEVATGNSLSNKVGNSGKFETSDLGKLTSRAVDKCVEEFVMTINQKFAEIAQNGHSVLIDFSFAEGSEHNMTTEVGTENLAISDLLEEWFSKNSFNNNYHIQGTTKLKMIFDDVRIPLTDKNHNNFTSNKYALEIVRYLKSVGLNPGKEIKGNAIYITIN